MVHVNGTMNARRYKDTLQEHLMPKMEEWFNEVPCIFQQDNAPCHKASSITEYLVNSNIDVMIWPPYSPDLSPIENLWAIIKSKLKSINITSKPILLQHLDTIWRDENIQMHCRKLIEGMPRRIIACVDAKGGPIKY